MRSGGLVSRDQLPAMRAALLPPSLGGSVESELCASGPGGGSCGGPPGVEPAEDDWEDSSSSSD